MKHSFNYNSQLKKKDMAITKAQICAPQRSDLARRTDNRCPGNAQREIKVDTKELFP